MIHDKNPIVMTLAEAYELGYVETREQPHKGYVTRRKRDPEDIPVYRVRKSSRGTKAGALYYYAPRYDKTWYCWRVYLANLIGWLDVCFDNLTNEEKEEVKVDERI